MSPQIGLVLIGLGALGLVEFGGLWLAVRHLDGQTPGSHTRVLAAAGVSRSRRRRLEHWIQMAPRLTAVSCALLICGALTSGVSLL